MTTRPASVDFWLYVGADFSEQVTLKDADGNPIDLTGATALMHVRRDISDANPAITFSTADDTIVLGDAAGAVRLKLTAVATKALYTNPGVDWDGEAWVHDLLLTFPTPTTERTFQGGLFVQPGVTRP